MGVVVGLPAWGNDQLLQWRLEALLAIEISSASRKPEVVQGVAVFVISRDDIARSGASSIHEALRLAPGVEVARIGNNRWAVSIRGFNGRFANKLQVFKDGRSIYSPLYSGVMWEAEDALLVDIERIEVIRGPSAAMWGSNAVNGVINIISRPASDTLGTQAVVSVGTNESGLLSVRQGFKLSGGDVRLSFKFSETEATPPSPRLSEPAAAAVQDEWEGRVPRHREFVSDYLPIVQADIGRSLTIKGTWRL